MNTIANQIAEQKKALAELEKKAKAQAKEHAKTVAEFQKYKKLVESGSSLFKSVMNYEHDLIQYGLKCPDEAGDDFADYFDDRDADTHELIFKMLGWTGDPKWNSYIKDSRKKINMKREDEGLPPLYN
jgi:hypothetical protein